MKTKSSADNCSFLKQALKRNCDLTGTMMCTHLEREKRLPSSVSFQEAVLTNFLLEKIPSHHLNHRWPHTNLPIRGKSRDHNKADKTINYCHFAFIIHSSITVMEYIFMPLALKMFFKVRFYNKSYILLLILYMLTSINAIATEK